MNRIVVGVGIAKRVFQLHWVEAQTGEIVALQLKRSGQERGAASGVGAASYA